MSEQHKQDGKPVAAEPPKAAAAPTPAGNAAPESQSQLSQLMAQGASAAGGKPEAASTTQPDLERRALAAAEQALAEGQRALDAARAQLRQQPATTAAAKQGKRRRELVLRVLLAVNLVAMATIALLPPAARTTTAPVTVDHGTKPPAHDPVVKAPDPNDPVLRAFAAADRRDWKTAITTLEQYLADSPRLDPGKRVNVLLALEHYTAQIGDFTAAQEYQRKTEALRNSHSLPEDLVQMALEAERAGDVESMRRHWARLLLQQRQIPSSLYRHVAEAYLKLGDSYRQEAQAAEDLARQEQLQQLRERLRAQAGGEQGK